jgi:hypothetical protein
MGWRSVHLSVPRRSVRSAEDHEAAAASTEREGAEEKAQKGVTGGRRRDARGSRMEPVSYAMGSKVR